MPGLDLRRSILPCLIGLSLLSSCQTAPKPPPIPVPLSAAEVGAIRIDTAFRDDQDPGVVHIPLVVDPKIWNAENPRTISHVQSYVSEQFRRIFVTLEAIEAAGLWSSPSLQVLQRLKPGVYEVIYVDGDGITRTPLGEVRVPRARRR